ncbi:MAG: hypothetical protein ACPGNV_09130 [Mangrovicoccus sp.]
MQITLNQRPSAKRLAQQGAVIALVAMLASTAQAQMSGHGSGGMHGHSHGFGHGHGADGTGHDEVNMPGLRGLNASPEESAEIAVLFRNFQSLTRDVTNLPNGIRSVTGSTDPAVMEALVSHVSGMIARVEAKDDPQIFIQSPTLDLFFAHGDEITSEITVTETEIIVTQTTENAELVEAMHIHAAEVTDMADRGMQAVHERMMRSAQQ